VWWLALRGYVLRKVHHDNSHIPLVHAKLTPQGLLTSLRANAALSSTLADHPPLPQPPRYALPLHYRFDGARHHGHLAQYLGRRGQWRHGCLLPHRMGRGGAMEVSGVLPQWRPAQNRAVYRLDFYPTKYLFSFRDRE
jgi:hypothetical protein